MLRRSESSRSSPLPRPRTKSAGRPRWAIGRSSAPTSTGGKRRSEPRDPRSRWRDGAGAPLLVTDADDDAREAYYAGRALLAAGDVDGAIAQLEASVAGVPHFKALELLGEAWLRKGERARAIIPLAAATTLNRQVRAPSLLAEALAGVGEEIQAHEIARLALERDPNNTKAKDVLEATAPAYRRWNEM